MSGSTAWMKRLLTSRRPPTIPQPLRDELLTYLCCTSPDRARIIAELLLRNPGMSELLADLEADDVLRAKLEISC
jgi:hypothetical protein